MKLKYLLMINFIIILLFIFTSVEAYSQVLKRTILDKETRNPSILR